MKNNCYKILKKAKTPISKKQLFKYTKNSIITPEYLIYQKHYLEYSYDENGCPTEPISLTDKGIDYIFAHKMKKRDFIKNFLSQFLSGFISGVAVTVLATVILHIIGIS